MKAILRADASAAVGTGHVARCLTLASALHAEGVSTVLATSKPTAYVREWASASSVEIGEIDASDDLATTKALIAREGASIIVVDGYGFDASYVGALRGDGRVVCVLDDLAASPIRADVVLNGNVYGDELVYDDIDPDTLRLLGPSYALVRDEFLAARGERLSRAQGTQSSERPRVLVTMGGADPTGETEKVIEGLAACAKKPLDVRIVVGGANPRGGIIRAAAGARLSPRHTVVILEDVSDLGNHMVWCDVALSAAGSTCLELACVGVASAVITVADNQRLVSASVARRGWMRSLGQPSKVSREIIRACLEEDLLADATDRRSMEDAQRAGVDGLGKKRVAEALITHYRSARGGRE